MSVETDLIIDKILGDPDYAHLDKKVIVLPGRDGTDTRKAIPSRRILILEACTITEIEQGRIEGIYTVDPLSDAMLQESIIKYYAPLAGVSRGDVPTAAEFLAMLPGDTALWTREVRSLNPGFFEWLDHADRLAGEFLKYAKEIDKKKSKKRRRSGRG